MDRIINATVTGAEAAKVQNTILVGIDRQSGGDYLLQPILAFRNMLQMDMPADIALS